MRSKKEQIAYLFTIFLCVLLLFLGYLFATRRGDFYAPSEGVDYYRAKVTERVHSEPQYDESGALIEENVIFSAKITSGDRKGEKILLHQTSSQFTPFNPRQMEAGDSVIVVSFESDELWYFVDFVRSDAIIVLCVAFAALLILFGRKKGLKTVLSLALTVFAVALVFIPAVLSGGNIYFWAVAVCIYIIAMTMALVNGFSPMSLASAIGCAIGVLSSLAITLVVDFFIEITGNADPHSIYLFYIGEGLDLKAIVYASVIIGCVGAVMDVAVDIAASLKELAFKLKRPTFRELYRSGINIGRDVIGTMSNTLVLAYMGGSMCSLLLYFYNNYANAVYLFNIEIIVVEMVKILVGSIGILLTLPITAFVSAWLYTREGLRRRIIRELEPEAPLCDEYTLMLENAETFDGENQRKD